MTRHQVLTRGEETGTTHQELTRGGPPPAAVLTRVLGRYARWPDPAHQAWSLIETLQSFHGIRLELTADGIVPRVDPGRSPPDADQTAVLRWLRPAVVAELRKRQPKAAAGPMVPPGNGRCREWDRDVTPKAIRERLYALVDGTLRDDRAPAQSLTILISAICEELLPCVLPSGPGGHPKGDTP